MATSETNPIHDAPLLREAYESLESEIDAVSEDDVAKINVDLIAAATMILGAVPAIMALRPKFVTDAPSFAMGQLDKLVRYAMATIHAHAQYLGATTPPEAIPELAARATKARELLFADASTAALRGYLNGDGLSQLLGTTGHRNIATDVLTLAGMLRSNWANLQGKCGTTLQELDQAEGVAYRLLNAVGIRDQAPSAVATVSLKRQRSYTLMVTAYDQVRRVVGYVRWDEGDAETIAPSLYAGRGGHKRTNSDKAKPVDPAAHVVEAAKPVAALNAVATTTPTNNKIPVGYPGSDPFTH